MLYTPEYDTNIAIKVPGGIPDRVATKIMVPVFFFDIVRSVGPIKASHN